MPSDDIIIVPLTHDLVTIIDAMDAERVLPFRWQAAWSGASWYARRCSLLREGRPRRVIFLHRLLMDAPPDLDVDHINGWTLDNRRLTNLRIATRSQNLANRHHPVTSNTGYRGVFRDPRRDRCFAQIRHLGKSIRLGTFDDPAVAALAYDEAARRLFGPFARTNFTETGERVV